MQCRGHGNIVALSDIVLINTCGLSIPYLEYSGIDGIRQSMKENYDLYLGVFFITCDLPRCLLIIESSGVKFIA